MAARSSVTGRWLRRLTFRKTFREAHFSDLCVTRQLDNEQLKRRLALLGK